MSKDELLEELGSLNDQVQKLMKEKDEIMAMKISQLGLKPNEDAKEEDKKPEDTKENPEDITGDPSIRFHTLASIDEALKNMRPKNYDNNFTLEELMEDFRCFSASQLKLYYDPVILRPFFAGLGCGKLIILQGISGTGKTSLAYA